MGPVISERGGGRGQQTCSSSCSWKMVCFALFVPFWPLSFCLGLSDLHTVLLMDCQAKSLKASEKVQQARVQMLIPVVLPFRSVGINCINRRPWKLGRSHMYCSLCSLVSLGSPPFATADQNQGDHCVIYWGCTSSFKNMQHSVVSVAHLFNVQGMADVVCEVSWTEPVHMCHLRVLQLLAGFQKKLLVGQQWP